MRYSQGDGVNTSLSRLVYKCVCLLYWWTGVPFLYVDGYLPWHGHVLSRTVIIKIMCGNQIYPQG